MSNHATNADDKAQRLLNVAGEVFAEKGQSATVREICSKAQCSVAAINYYFGDKQQLYLQCVQTACEQKEEKYPLPSSEQLAEVTDPPVMLQRFLRAITERLVAKSSESWHNTLMLREVINPSKGVRDILTTPFRRDFHNLRSIFEELFAGIESPEELIVDFATQTLARCMFLRTGKNLRSILHLDTESNEIPEHYADSISRSIIDQVNQTRQMHDQPVWQWPNPVNT